MGTWSNFLKWQNYVHYIILTLGLFLFHALPFTTKLELGGNYFYMFMWYLLGLFVIDTLIHIMFTVLPEPFRWVD